MKFETIHFNKKKKMIAIVIFAFVIGITIGLVTSKAAYRTTESINIATGTIDYNPGDLNILAVKIQKENTTGTEESDYETSNVVPTGNYALNRTKSYCNYNNNGTPTNINTKFYYDNTLGIVDIRIEKKGTKCYLYYDRIQSQLINYTMLYDGSLNNATTNQMTSVTGGWTADGWDEETWSTWVPKTSGTLSNNSMILNSASSNSVWLGTANSIPVEMGDSLFGRMKRTDNISTNRFFIELRKEKKNNANIVINGNGAANFVRIVCSSKNVVEIKNATIAEEVSYAYASAIAYQQGAGTVYEVWITKPDNWQELVSITGVTEPENMLDLLSDSEKITTILNNKEAVKYMITQCTGDFLGNAIASQTFMTAYRNSPYKSLIDSNSHWSKFISLAIY